MSNDARFWTIRLILFAAIAVDLWLLTKLQASAGVPDAHGPLWAGLFFVSVILTMPLGFVAYVTKRKRWEKTKPMDRIEVETLSAYSKAEKMSKTPKK